MFFFKKKAFSYPSFLKKAKKYPPFEQEKYNELAEHLRTEKKYAEKGNLGLRLIVISDTHGHFAYGQDRFPEFMKGVSEYDLCILLGDISPYDLEQILKVIPKEKIIAVKGNHDAFDVYERFGIEEISGKTVKRFGVTLAGIEGSFKYKKATFPSFTQYESLVLAEKMEPADILISHDCMFERSKNDAAHAGLLGITYYVYKNAPAVHIHGHIHQSFEETYDNGTVRKCVYLCEYMEI